VADELEAILETPEAKPGPSPAPAAPPPAVSAERVAAKERRQSLAAQFLAKRALSEDELAEVEKSARRQFDLRQYQQVVEIIGRAREDQLPARLQGLLADARSKCGEIAALVAAIDEAARSGDRMSALEKVETLLRIQPRHPRACEVKAQFERNPTVSEIARPKARIWWIAGLVAVAIVVLVIFAAMMGRHSDEPNTSTPSISSPPSPPQTPSPDKASAKGAGQ
jgi:hypothetical protein